MRTIDAYQVLLQAHRGVSTDYPENTMAAFRAACEQGYDVIELDPKFTADGYCVVLHDGTVNRTGRTAQGEALKEPCPIEQMTLAEARSLEYGSWRDKRFAGEPLPLLSEVLALAKKWGMPLKIDNVIERFNDEQTERLFELVEQSELNELAGFTCKTMEYLRKVAARFPKAGIHYDGSVDAQTLSAVAQAAQGHALTVWLPYPNRLTDWCKMPPLTPERAQMVREYGARVGAWILEDEDELRAVCAQCKVDIVETTGSLKPDQRGNQKQ